MPTLKLKISPGQGLLLLIEHYKSDALKVEQLKKLYLSGGEEISTLMQDPVLAPYDTSFDEESISTDPS